MFESLTQRLSQSFSFLRGKKELTPENVDEGLRSVRQALLEADVHFQLARDFTERVRTRLLGEERLKGVDPSEQFVHAFHRELVELMGPEDARLVVAKSGPTVILMAGLQGAGKTTTCAKLAKYLREKHQRRPLLVAADIKRPAAVEQLQVLGKRLDVPVFHRAGLKPPELCAEGVEEARRRGCDVVILDTAGRLHVDDELMAEVAEIARRTKPHNQLLVVDAMTGQDAVASAKAFHERLELTGVILTKLDGDARGGAALSIRHVTAVPIKFIGTGERPEAFERFHADRMVGRILGMGDVLTLIEKAEGAIDAEEAKELERKLRKNEFTLQEFRDQIRMLKRMGPLSGVIAMLPGMSHVKESDLDPKAMVRVTAIIDSMTPRERRLPQLLNAKRKRRIARGSGQTVQEINRLLKQFAQMKRMMKNVQAMAKAGKGRQGAAGGRGKLPFFGR